MVNRRYRKAPLAGILACANDSPLTKKTRCWKGYEPTPGKKPYSKGSCRKA